MKNSIILLGFFVLVFNSSFAQDVGLSDPQPIAWSEHPTYSEEPSAEITKLSSDSLFEVSSDPLSSTVNIRFKSKHIEPAYITVCDDKGNCVYHTVQKQQGFKEQVDLSARSRGIYFVEILKANSVEKRKIVLD